MPGCSSSAHKLGTNRDISFEVCTETQALCPLRTLLNIISSATTSPAAAKDRPRMAQRGRCCASAHRALLIHSYSSTHNAKKNSLETCRCAPGMNENGLMSDGVSLTVLPNPTAPTTPKKSLETCRLAPKRMNGNGLSFDLRGCRSPCIFVQHPQGMQPFQGPDHGLSRGRSQPCKAHDVVHSQRLELQHLCGRQTSRSAEIGLLLWICGILNETNNKRVKQCVHPGSWQACAMVV